jgi:hypothetical protein
MQNWVRHWAYMRKEFDGAAVASSSSTISDQMATIRLLSLIIIWTTIALNVNAQCDNYGIQSGTNCTCPPGVGGANCSFPVCGGTLFDGPERPTVAPIAGALYGNLSSCTCPDGWTGVACNGSPSPLGLPVNANSLFYSLLFGPCMYHCIYGQPACKHRRKCDRRRHWCNLRQCSCQTTFYAFRTDIIFPNSSVLKPPESTPLVKCPAM